MHSAVSVGLSSMTTNQQRTLSRSNMQNCALKIQEDIGSHFLCGGLVITIAQLYSTKPELRFCASSNPACGVSEIRNSKDL